MSFDLFEALLEVVEVLDSAGIQHALAGGLAVAVHGAPRATADIDLLVRPERAEDAVRELKAAGFGFEALRQTFGDGTAMRRVSRVRDGETLTVDLLEASGELEAALTSREIRTIEDGRTLSVVSRAMLIAMKVRAGRPQDLADVERLTELDR